MAFTASGLRVGETADPASRQRAATALATAFATEAASSLAGVGGGIALGRACAAFVEAWRTTNVDAERKVSANHSVTINCSATSALVTVQFQIVPTA